MSRRWFTTEEFYAWLLDDSGNEPFDPGKRGADPYWKEAERLTRWVNRKLRERIPA